MAVSQFFERWALTTNFRRIAKGAIVPMATDDILYRVNITWYLLGQNCINSFFFRSKPGNTYSGIPAEMNDLHNNIGNDILNPLRNIMSNDCQLFTSVLTNLTGETFYEDARTYAAQFGNVSSPSMPSYCSKVISWRTDYRGRRVHGRTYVPGVPLVDVNGNQLTTTAQTSFHSNLQTILDNFSIGSRFSYPYFVVFSRRNGTVREPGPPPFLSYSSLAGVPITNFVADQFIYTNRHRLVGRGI